MEVNGRRFSIPWRVLVVDHNSMRTISSCCRMHEIALEGILIVESINKKRQRFPKYEAIYLLTPTEPNVDALINDFKDAGKPTYGKIHVFFTEGIGKDGAVSFIQIMKPF